MKSLGMMTVLLLTVMSSPVGAEISVQYLGPIDTWPSVPAPLTTDGIIGNTNDPGYILPADELSGYFMGSTFNPNAYDCNCDLGFEVMAYHFVVAKLDDAPTSLDMHLSLGDAYLLEEYPLGTTCYLPSRGENYSFGIYCHDIGNQLELTGSGFYKVSLTNISECGCVLMTYAHIMGFFTSQFYSDLRPVTSIDPGHCPDYVGNTGFGRIWWTEIDAPGNLVLWADVDCYEIPVGVEGSTWSTLKAMYR